MKPRPTLERIIGAAVWVFALVVLAKAAFRVSERTARPAVSLTIEVPAGTAIVPGDTVYLSTDQGLEPVGEVALHPSDQRAVLSIAPAAFAKLTQSTSVVCWRTPMSSAATLDALFPEKIQRAAAQRIAADWRKQDERLAAAWGPLIADLSAAYLRLISKDVEVALHQHEDQLWSAMEWHGRALTDVWPSIQEHLRPILQEHLTPVLGRLMSQAISDAPKMSIAWHLARGRQEQAYRLMLDWLADYLARVPESDRHELNMAIRAVWDKARHDPDITEPLTKLGRDVLEDERLRDILTEIYREAISDNPKTAEFFRSQVLESEEVRDRFYALIDAFAPTAKHLAALCLFDENGKTRPEVVHLVRSVALRRQVSWITLMVQDESAPPLQPGATVVATSAGGDG